MRVCNVYLIHLYPALLGISSSSSKWCLFSSTIRELYTHGMYFLLSEYSLFLFSLLVFHSVPSIFLYAMLLLLNFSHRLRLKNTRMAIVPEVFQNFRKKKQHLHNMSSFSRTIKQDKLFIRRLQLHVKW
jgi:hypothetical protein